MLMTFKTATRILTILALCLTLLGTNTAQAQMGIAVTVNDNVITHHDLNERLNLVLASSGLPNTPQTRAKLRPQILDALIEEQIQFQEAERLGITLPPEQLEAGFIEIAKNNKLTAPEFRAQLQKTGASLDSLMEQIEARLLWTEVFAKSLRARVNVSDTDINSALNRMKSSIGSTEYLLFEIFLPVTNPRNEAKTKQLAGEVLTDITQRKAPFAAVAKQISKSASAKNGGALGWVQGDQLDKALHKVVQTMQPKSLSLPIRSLSGYHILYLAAKRKITKDAIPPRAAVRNKIFMQRAERLSQNRLKSLKNQAYIDNRLQ